ARAHHARPRLHPARPGFEPGLARRLRRPHGRPLLLPEGRHAGVL
ncbi:MAG: Thiol peroxidase, Bcp-type, partial [uncultured Solirubrobacteraceae bacterium]